MKAALLTLAAACFAMLGLAGRADEPPALVRLTHDGLFKQRPAWSPNGRQLSFARHRGDMIWLHVAGAETGDERRLTDRQDPEYDAAWSPDGERLAFSLVRVSGSQGDLDVYTIAADGSDLRPLATTLDKLSHEEWPAWSPNGESITYTSTREGNQEICVMSADGGEDRRLTNDLALDAHPAWSPDGRQIAFATDRWGDLELAVVDADGSNLRRLTTSAGLDDYPAWSPDGQHLAFTSNRDGNFEVYVIDRDGENPRNITQDEALDNFPAWTPDDRLTFVSNRDGGFDIYVTEGRIRFR